MDRMTIMRLAVALCLPLAAGFGAFGAAAQQQGTPGVALELNMLEAREGGCRTHFVVRNDTASPYESFKLDLVVFGQDGVIARRLAVEAAPLRANKSTVKAFELQQLPCDRIGQILVNDVIGCRDAEGEKADCVDRLVLATRTDVKLTK